MPVSPEEAKKMREARYQEEYALACHKLDAYLSTTPPTIAGEWWFDLSGFGNIKYRLIETYTAAGWDVRVYSDARDGTSLVLSVKK